MIDQAVYRLYRLTDDELRTARVEGETVAPIQGRVKRVRTKSMNWRKPVRRSALKGAASTSFCEPLWKLSLIHIYEPTRPD